MSWLHLAETALRDPAALRMDRGDPDPALSARLVLLGVVPAAAFGVRLSRSQPPSA